MKEDYLIILLQICILVYTIIINSRQLKIKEDLYFNKERQRTIIAMLRDKGRVS
jgi:hypothetical protein